MQMRRGLMTIVMGRVTGSGLCLVVTLALGSCLVSSEAHAFDTVFRYQVDSFQLSDPVRGVEVDNFDDGVLYPWVTNGLGTAVESDGVVTLSNPGVHSGFAPLIPDVVLDRSDIFAPTQYAVAKGLGSFEATSTWIPILPELPGGFYGLVFTYFVPGTTSDMRVFGVFIVSLWVGQNPRLQAKASAARWL